MKFHLLGSLDIRNDDGTPVAVPQPQQRALISALLLHANEPVSKSRLAELLWGPQHPSSASGMLRTYIWRTRRLLGGEDRLRTQPGGYMLRVEPGELDADRFRHWADEGEHMLGTDPGGAAELLRRALDLWRAPVLGDLPPAAALEAKAVFLVDRRRTAERSLVQAELATAGHHRVLARLRAMTASDPLDEHAWAQLMLALYRCGRQADALQAFSRVRALLADECGVDPGPELRGLQDQILREDPALRHRSADEQSDPAGWDRPGTATPRPHQLPADVADFTGRADECDRVLGFLCDAGGVSAPGVVLVCGQPGVGKTALAVHAAHRVRDRFPDGQLYVGLGASTEHPKDIRGALAELLRSLGVPDEEQPETAEERASLFRSRLAGQRVLVVADDVASVAQTALLAPGMPGSALLMTSRVRLAGPPGTARVNLEPLSEDDALLMLARVVGADRTGAEPEAARRLAALCARLPLALRAAGSRLAARANWPLETLAEILGDPASRLDLLETCEDGVRSRMASGYAGLDPQARRAVRLLARTDLDDVASWVVAVLLGTTRADVVVDALVDRGLLGPVGIDATGEPRYRLPELLRLYAASLPDDTWQPPPGTDPFRSVAADGFDPLGGARAGAADSGHLRLVDAWLFLARAADRRVPRVPHLPAADDVPGAHTEYARAAIPDRIAARITADPAAWFGAEHANLRRVLRHECARSSGSAARLADRMLAWQLQHGLFDDADDLWRGIADGAERDGDHATLAHALVQSACLDLARDRFAAALASAERCVGMVRRRSDTPGLARALAVRARCRAMAQDLPGACADAYRALTLFEECGDPRGQLVALHTLGCARAALGDQTVVCREGRRARMIAERLDDPAYRRMAQHMLARLAVIERRYEDAIELCHEELAPGRAGHTLGKAYFLDVLNEAYQGLGNLAQANEALDAAARIFQNQGVRVAVATCHLKQGSNYLRLGDTRKTVEHARSCLPVFEHLGMDRRRRQARALLDQCGAGAAQ